MSVRCHGDGLDDLFLCRETMQDLTPELGTSFSSPGRVLGVVFKSLRHKDGTSRRVIFCFHAHTRPSPTDRAIRPPEHNIHHGTLHSTIFILAHSRARLSSWRTPEHDFHPGRLPPTPRPRRPFRSPAPPHSIEVTSMRKRRKRRYLDIQLPDLYATDDDLTAAMTARHPTWDRATWRCSLSGAKAEAMTMAPAIANGPDSRGGWEPPATSIGVAGVASTPGPTAPPAASWPRSTSRTPAAGRAASRSTRTSCPPTAGGSWTRRSRASGTGPGPALSEGPEPRQGPLHADRPRLGVRGGRPPSSRVADPWRRPGGRDVPGRFSFGFSPSHGPA